MTALPRSSLIREKVAKASWMSKAFGDIRKHHAHIIVKGFGALSLGSASIKGSKKGINCNDEAEGREGATLSDTAFHIKPLISRAAEFDPTFAVVVKGIHQVHDFRR